ncbi:GNAT family N-acetyltransferase [Thalassococcus lentus]|uniref:GNAT family N-acetyltransferase n=1 Tax=Thalassococcus lentus TaxID=1210524 RepID=A0ABT4XPB1_9RHOB|nr:GNAT family N-acetyltransferase [Thalassococcus lentus]MDA7423788.1 GNAT family N-acetyltransferase [Thalassococcus lentus]
MSFQIETTQDIDACHALRRAVFIEEQGIAEADEWDDLDQEATHLLVRDGDQPVATARLLYDGATGKIGRICVLKSYRGRGLGEALIDASLTLFARRPKLTQAYLSAQDHAIPFYEKLGFEARGDQYDDAGIPHRDMVRPL